MDPVILGFVESPGGSLTGVAMAGTLAYVASTWGSLYVYDIANPAIPTQLGTVEVASALWDVTVSGQLAFLTGPNSGLHVVDVSDPASPVLLDSIEMTHPIRLAVSGTTAYVANGTEVRSIDLAPCDTCPTDLDGNGDVGFADLLIVLSLWGSTGGPADLDGSGFVGFADLLILLSAWGPCA